MARNKKIKNNGSARKTPRKMHGHTPKVTKPRMIDMNRVNKRKHKSGISHHLALNKNQIRQEIAQNRNKNPTSISREILYPPVPPPHPPESIKSATTATSKSPRRKRSPAANALAQPTATIVIDSDDDDDDSHQGCSVPEPPLFYLDITGGFNAKEVPQYINFGERDDCVELVENNNTLEEGELRDSDDEEDMNVGTLDRTINEEEIPISDDEEGAVGTGGVKRMDSNDHSVIFCSEVIDLDREDDRSKVLEFIPIGYDYAAPKAKSATPDRNSRKAKPKKQATTPVRKDKEVSGDSKRMVIIDGNNVAYSHVCGQAFSVKGLDICIKYFKKMGHKVKAVVPQFRLKRDKTTDHKHLEELYKAGDVLLAPSKSLPGQFSSSYDDRLIISVAEKFDGVIISNDNFRDLLTESDSWKKIIQTRVIGYTWVEDAFFLPDDPYGRHGPKLKDLLEPKASSSKG